VNNPTAIKQNILLDFMMMRSYNLNSYQQHRLKQMIRSDTISYCQWESCITNEEIVDTLSLLELFSNKSPFCL